MKNGFHLNRFFIQFIKEYPFRHLNDFRPLSKIVVSCDSCPIGVSADSCPAGAP